MRTYITIYCQSVKLETNDGSLVNHITRFIDEYYKQVNDILANSDKLEVTLYVSKITNYNVWYFHINQFKHFTAYLQRLGYNVKSLLEGVVDLRNYNSVKHEYKMQDSWVLRDYQEKVVEFLTTKPEGSKLVPLVPGKGKTVIGLWASSILKDRLALVILPQFIDKWVADITNIHQASNKEILVMQGTDAISGLVGMAEEGTLTDAYKYFIFSSRTLQNYVKLFEEDPETCVSKYGCSPVDLFPKLGIGTLLVDETHMAFHALFKVIIHTNVKYQIGLSATLISNDPVVNRAQNVMYPTKDRYDNNELERYYDVYPISYNIDSSLLRDIKTSNRGMSFYSHTQFEKSICRKSSLLNEYVNLIKTTIDDYYIEDYLPPDKCAIFVATVKLATILTERLSNVYKDKKVVRYTQEDSYDEMLTGDLIVSTVGSLGTGIDITTPDGVNALRAAIQTVSIASDVSNIQTAGRLRKLKDRDTKFIYLYCPQIRSQKVHHNKRLQIFRSRAKHICNRASTVSIRPYRN